MSTNPGLVKPIALALQGGGAHGAFAWGVLDRLLEDERLAIEGVSATSAGAMNAAVLAYGLLKGGPPAPALRCTISGKTFPAPRGSTARSANCHGRFGCPAAMGSTARRCTC